MASVTITSNEDFIEFTKRVLLDNDNSIDDVKFDGWPTVNYYIKGERYNQSLPITAMEGYVGYQQELYRLFTDLKYNSASLQMLRADDKADLELVFRVKEGSSDTEADGWSLLNKLTDSLTAITTGMDGMEKLILIITIAGFISGSFCYYVRSNRKLENEQFLAQQETTRAALLTGEKNLKESCSLLQDVLTQHPSFNATHTKAIDYSERANTTLMRRVSDAEFVRTGNNEYREAEIREFSRRQRGENGKRNERVDDFYIDGIERMDQESLLIKTTKVSSNAQIRMKALASIIGDDLEALTNAFLTGSAVKVKYMSSVRAGDEYSAQFSYVVAGDDSESDEAQEHSA
ncbi:hypothetical protein [Photobacterium nomapromontoriensis]|uniref:hypothetical protein n=1 Tax=Photobacterium nomapromontoriensis TaxID=2910237 RepID=UPI003D115ED6